MVMNRPTTALFFFVAISSSLSAAVTPPQVDWCERLQHDVQGRKTGFMAGNLSYYVGGFHASWKPFENETIGLTHPFYHDLRSRGTGLAQSTEQGHLNTGLGNDFGGWEFYKKTRVLYGSVTINGQRHKYPVPLRMYWRPDKMICEYEVDGVKIREEKFIAANDAACSIITSSEPVTLSFDGHSFLGQDSIQSSATQRYDKKHNAILIKEGGTTRCRPHEGPELVEAPIMYQDMTTVLSASRDFSTSHQLAQGEKDEQRYTFDIPCDAKGVAVVWSMHDEEKTALRNGRDLVEKAERELTAKTREMNRQLTEEIPWFRCSDERVEDIYYYLWSLYLMYYIDVQKGWEMENHTQTAVNNFLGMHRYDAMFQIRTGAWLADKERYSYGNVLTWKHLFTHGCYKKNKNGVIELSDNKGTTWHSGCYGPELSEHVLGAWQVYQHSGDLAFLRNCYEGYYREFFWDGVIPFYMNQFEVSEVLTEMAKLTGHPEDVAHWKGRNGLDPDYIRNQYDQRWSKHDTENFFMAPKDGMLMTTGFWPMRSKYFPREYAQKMVEHWAVNQEDGFFGEFFPLAMARKAMKKYATNVDHAFGYTPDTAYFTLTGMFTQHLGDYAWKLTLNHLLNYNYSEEWKMPMAPEAYDRAAKPFGDQYSNFNAGKILLILEGLAGIKYSLPDNQLTITDTMPRTWEMMEVGIPLRAGGERRTQWTRIRYDRKEQNGSVIKTITVSDSPLAVTINPWLEGGELKSTPEITGDTPIEIDTPPPGYTGYRFNQETGRTISVKVNIQATK